MDQEFVDSEGLQLDTHINGNRQIENGDGEIDQSLSASRTTLIFTSVDYEHDVLVPLSPLAFSTTRPEPEDQYRSILADAVDSEITDLFIEDQLRANGNGVEPSQYDNLIASDVRKNTYPAEDSFGHNSHP